MRKMYQIIGVVGLSTILLQGCGSISMEANSKMTNSIFFKNIQPKKTAFIVAKNSTPVDSELGNQVKQKLQNRGYILMDNPDNAQYIVQVNALNMNEEHEQKALKTATAAGATTAIVSYAVNHSGKDALGSGLAVGAVAGLFAYATADGHVRMQADVLITEKLADNKTIEHSTRVFAEATQMRLTVAEAQPILEDKISTQIAGIFN